MGSHSPVVLILIKMATEVSSVVTHYNTSSPSHPPDLVVGAHESQSVFILRTRPVAIVNITITLNSEEVMLQDYDCLYQGKPIAW